MEEHKKKIEKMIIDATLTAFEKKEIVEDELSKIADVVLRKIDLAQTHEQLIIFLRELASRWTIFKNILIIEQGEEERAKELSAGKKVINLIQTGRPNEAVDLARKAA